jgi:hypothetical protein
MLSISNSNPKNLPSLSDFIKVVIEKEDLKSTFEKCINLMKEEYVAQKESHNSQKEHYNTLKTNKQQLTATERKALQLKIDVNKLKRQTHQDAWLVLYEKLKLLVEQIKTTEPEFKLEHQESLDKIKEDFQNPKWRV